VSVFGLDAFSPAEIAQRLEQVGVTKARMPFFKTALLGILAGAFIGLGSLYFTIVSSDASLSFAVSKVLGGVVFSLGLLLVVVAGAELFTGNNLLAMAWASKLITTKDVLRNWLIVSIANFIGAAGLAIIVYLSGHSMMNNGLIAEKIISIAVTKCTLPASELFWRGVLCNILVCLAVWMAMAGRTVTDKFFAIVLPISAFVAAGFEHSIANMYFIPLAMLLQNDVATVIPGSDQITIMNMLRNFMWVIPGNLLGGSVLVALVYHVIYGKSSNSVSE
jgi:formate/nitrite transporter